MNPLTNEQYHIGDVCEPAKFNESCSSCAAEVRCQFTKYTRAASWMHWFNLFGFYWGMFFVSALRFVPEFDSILFQAQVASSMPIWVDLAVTRMQTKKMFDQLLIISQHRLSIVETASLFICSEDNKFYTSHIINVLHKHVT